MTNDNLLCLIMLIFMFFNYNFQVNEDLENVD